MDVYKACVCAGVYACVFVYIYIYMCVCVCVRVCVNWAAPTMNQCWNQGVRSFLLHQCRLATVKISKCTRISLENVFNRSLGGGSGGGYSDQCGE